MNEDGQDHRTAPASSSYDQQKTAPQSYGTPESKERPATGGNHGILRPDAKWVVLLGALSAAVSLLTYAGIQWPWIMHFVAARPSSHQSSQPLPTFPSSAQSATSSPSPSTSPSPTQSSSPALVPSDYDNVATDPTDVTVATMLPEQFNDSGLVFSRTNGFSANCPDSDVDNGVSDTLQADGCTQEFIGDYLGSYREIQVTVWVIPMPYTSASVNAYNTLATPGSANDWGIWCPTAGVGAPVCQGPWQDATRARYMGTCHRYLVRALALDVNLAPDSSLQPDITAAARAAIHALGAENLGPIAACWPSTAVTPGG